MDDYHYIQRVSKLLNQIRWMAVWNSVIVAMMFEYERNKNECRDLLFYGITLTDLSVWLIADGVQKRWVG